MAWYTPLRDLLLQRPNRPAPPAEQARELRLDSVYNPLTGLGGQGDKGMVGRPNPYIQPLSLEELALLYENNGISRRLVDIVPTRACRRGWIAPDMASEDKRLKIWAKVQEAMAMARLYGDSLMLLVTEDDVPALRRGQMGWLRTPLDTSRIGRVEALHVIDATECAPLTWDRDPTSPTFRLPAEYSVFAEGLSLTIHASRTILFRGVRRPPGRMRYGTVTRMPDLPFLQAVWDEVRRLTETLQGGAILAAEIRESVLKIAELTNRSTGDDAAALESRISLLSRTKSLMGILLLGEGESYDNRSNPPTGFKELTSAAWEALAAATGIPQVILMGSTPGGLNTDGASSWEGFRQLVSSYQEEHRDTLEQLYGVLYAAQDGPTNGRPPDEWELTFAPLDEPDQQTIATTRASIAATDVQYINAGVYSAGDVARSRFGPGGWSLDLLPVDPNGAPVPVQPAAAPTIGTPAPLSLDGLSGVQMRETNRIVSRVLAGELSHETGIALLQTALDVSKEVAAHLLDVWDDEAGEDEAGEEETGDDEAGENEAGEDVEEQDPKDLRYDERSGCCVLVPAAGVPEYLRVYVEGLIGQDLELERAPHVTALYLGEVADPSEVVAVVAELAQEVEARVLQRGSLRAFPAGERGTPIVVEFDDAWPLAELNGALLRRLAHLVTARQHRRFRAHLTVGYAPEPLTPEQVAALMELDASEVRVPVAQLEVRVGDALVASVPVG